MIGTGSWDCPGFSALTSLHASSSLHSKLRKCGHAVNRDEHRQLLIVYLFSSITCCSQTHRRGRVRTPLQRHSKSRIWSFCNILTCLELVHGLERTISCQDKNKTFLDAYSHPTLRLLLLQYRFSCHNDDCNYSHDYRYHRCFPNSDYKCCCSCC